MSKSSRRRARTKARKQKTSKIAARRAPAGTAPASVAPVPPRNPALTVVAIARSELRGLLGTPVGWAIAAVFLFFASGFGFIGGVIAGQQASFDGIFQVVTGVLTVILAPVITLRLGMPPSPSIPAREYELVLLILGRWVGALAFYLLLIATTLVYVVLLAIYVRGKQLDLGLIGATYIGMSAAGGAAVAIGVFSSSVTRNRIAAYLLAIGLLALAWYSTFVVGAFGGAARNDLLDYVSAFNRYQSFSLGQVTLRDSVYFISVTLGALLLAMPLMRSRR